MTVPLEQLECVERIVLGILADMTNAERSLTEVLVACYISGAQHAICATGGRAHD